MQHRRIIIDKEHTESSHSIRLPLLKGTLLSFERSWTKVATETFNNEPSIAIGTVYLSDRRPRVMRMVSAKSECRLPPYFAIVMLGTPTRGTSVTVIWNRRYKSWKASRFHRASGPRLFTA